RHRVWYPSQSQLWGRATNGAATAPNKRERCVSLRMLRFLAASLPKRCGGNSARASPMKIQFDDPLFEAWTQRPMLNIPEGGAEIGEIKATAARIPEGDRDAW